MDCLEEACQLAQHSGDESALRQAADYLLGSGQHEVRSEVILLQIQA